MGKAAATGHPPAIKKEVDRIYGHWQNRLMKQIGAAQFKQQCLAILDRLGPEGLIVTKHGRPIARVTPIGADSASLIGCLRGKLKIKGSILTTGERWDAES